MNRTQRINQLRQERENGGLQQVVQLPGLGPLPTLRKTTFTRPELLQRGSLGTNANRNKRGCTLNNNNNNQNRLSSVAPVVTVDAAMAGRRLGASRPPFLPRVARLVGNTTNNNNNNNNNMIRVNNREKSPLRKHLNNSALVSDNSSSLPSLEPAKKLAQLAGTPQMASIACGNSCSLSTSSTSNCNSNSSYEMQKIKLAKAFRLPDEQNRSFVYLCKPVKQVQELLTAHPLICRSDDNVSKLGLADSQEESDSLSYDSSLNSQRQQLSPKGFEELGLRTQRAQSARGQLEATWGKGPAGQDETQRRLEMDLVCHNIPTLQREIRLLQQLGEKLEATLRANTQTTSTANIQTETCLKGSSSSSVFYTPRSTLTLLPGALPLVHCGWRRVEHLPVASQRACCIAVIRYFGTIEEFRIETKTLTELKTADESQCFYLPMSEDGGLQLTSFRKLRENPNVLLQQLRPLTPTRPFNLLEQDAMFFNSMLAQVDAMEPVPPRESGGTAVVNLSLTAAQSTPYTRLTVRGASMKDTDSKWHVSDVERLLLPALSESEKESVLQAQAPSVCNSLFNKLPHTKNRNLSRCKRSKFKPAIIVPMKLQRHFKPRLVAPLKPEAPELEPQMQTHLLKTVLVGIVQVALFLVLIMAFTYPDIRC